MISFKNYHCFFREIEEVYQKFFLIWNDEGFFFMQTGLG